MARKSRRVRKKGREVRLSPTQLVQPGVSGTVDALPEASQMYSAPAAADLREEYGYVAADLKRIGLIAAAVLAVLVVLTFVLV